MSRQTLLRLLTFALLMGSGCSNCGDRRSEVSDGWSYNREVDSSGDTRDTYEKEPRDTDFPADSETDGGEVKADVTAPDTDDQNSDAIRDGDGRSDESCTSYHESCTSDAECCRNLPCVDGTCRCKNAGNSCSSDTECCSGQCGCVTRECDTGECGMRCVCLGD